MDFGKERRTRDQVMENYVFSREECFALKTGKRDYEKCRNDFS